MKQTNGFDLKSIAQLEQEERGHASDGTLSGSKWIITYDHRGQEFEYESDDYAKARLRAFNLVLVDGFKNVKLFKREIHEHSTETFSEQSVRYAVTR